MSFDATECAALIEGLSPRQKEILALIARGMSSKEIASELGISVRTEEHHREQIYFRLQIRSASEAVAVALTAYR